MTVLRNCPQCGAAIHDDSPQGLCPRCLLGVGMGRAGAGYDVAQTEAPMRRFTPPKPSQLAPHFPQLEILDLLGQGGMGAVYKARQRGLDRLVALKILPPDTEQDPTFAERFSREARTLARLNHPSIVSVHDFGQAGGFYYFIMEYVDGISLRQAIDTGMLSPKEALAIVPQICDALQFAHDEGVVHRDIKPENVLLDRRGRVKIADFGLARLLGQVPEDGTLTGTHQVMGTPRYMAPEQMEGSHTVDHRADIYSLGVVFYEMLTRELPLGRFPPPSRKVQIDVRLDDVVLRTLEKEPSRRYQRAAEIKTDVESISGHTIFPPLNPRYFGYEYRSSREFLGWPLVHIAKGFDPRTGRQRVARGIIAMGDVALGGILAIGGMACAPIAIGGLAIGLFTLGGLSIGLLAAIGGGAIGMGISGGGGAVGTLAAGGGALGVYAYGGGAFGLHAYSAAWQDPAAAALWTAPAGEVPSGVLLVLGFLSPLVLLLLLLGFAAVTARPATTDANIPPVRDPFPPQVIPPRRGFTGAGIGCLLAALLSVPIVALCCLVAPFFVLHEARVQTRAGNQAATLESAAIPAAQRGWHMTSEGPVLDSFLEQRLRLSPKQHDDVAAVIRAAFEEYLVLEMKFVHQERPGVNRVVTTIDAFPDEFAAVENRLWTGLDAVLNRDQQVLARHYLPVRSERMVPGLLGWGGEACQITVWQVGTWFHWSISARAGGGPLLSSSAPQLPAEYQRFWNNAADVLPTPTDEDE
jgi:predicted Ser/Thr protein kinase